VAASVVAVVVLLSVMLLSGAPSMLHGSDQFADANSRKKVHFTETVTSMPDPSEGASGSSMQMALILSPNTGTIYDGSLTFAASSPVRPMILHAMTGEDVKAAAETGLPMWTVDGQTVYAASFVGSETSAASFEFTGAAVALHTESAERFTATVSVDAWVRGEPTKIIMQTIEVDLPEEEPRLLLSRTSVPAVIPMHKGIYEGEALMYIITDGSDAEYADKITQSQGWRVEHAPAMGEPPESVLQQVYVFKNGVEGDGLYGYQDEVFSSTPADSMYSALSEVIEVTWKPGQNRILFENVDDILRAEDGGRIDFERPNNVILNAPQVAWPDGEAVTRADDNFTTDMVYGGGQITEINREEMTVTFVAHRGWGPDGRTIYHIVTGATPQRPAELIGVEQAPAYAGLVDHSAVSDLYIFNNGIVGSGSLGYQASIAGAAPGDEEYTPMWRIYVVEWNDPEDVAVGVLENISDIDLFRDKEMLTASMARPTNSYYVINAPIVEPFQ